MVYFHSTGRSSSETVFAIISSGTTSDDLDFCGRFEMMHISPSSEDLNLLGGNAAKKLYEAKISFNVSGACISALGTSNYCY